MILANDHYIGVGGSFVIDKNHEYFYSQSYTPTIGNPFQNVIPVTNNFWGPRVLTLQIVSRLLDWNQTLVDMELERFRNMYSNWEKFEYRVWIDRVPANEVDTINGNNFYSVQLNTLSGHIEDTCNLMADFGWYFMGDLTENVGSEFFQPYIDQFN